MRTLNITLLCNKQLSSFARIQLGSLMGYRMITSERCAINSELDYNFLPLRYNGEDYSFCRNF